MTGPTLSVAIVCKNNADTIGRTLESIKGLANEIVAVDSGSTDGTIDLLRAHGVRVIASEWLGHVKTKQKALEACTGEWILSLDSDESLDAALRGAFEGEGLFSTNIDGYEFRRVVYYRDRALRFAWQPEFRLRLVRRGAARWTGLDPHDQLVLNGPGQSVRAAVLKRVDQGHIRHDSIGTWSAFFQKQAGHARTMATSLHATGKRGSVWKLATSPVGAFLKQIVLKQAWRDGWPGWAAAASTAASAMMKHAMLLEIESAAKGEPSHTLDQRGG